MNGQVLILALVAVAAGCLEAALVPTNGADFPVKVAPEGYSNFAPQAPGSYQPEYYGQANMAPVQQEPQLMNERGHRRFINNVRQIGKIGAGAAKRAYQEAKPTFHDIGDDIGELGQRFKKDPRVQRVAGVVVPQLENIKNRAQPIFQRGKGVVERAQARLHQQRQQQGPYAPGSVYPVPPPNQVAQ